MNFLHYTLHPDSPIVKVYDTFQQADLITVSNTTNKQLIQCDPLRGFEIMSAQDITQPTGSAVLFKKDLYTLLHFIPSVCSVTLVLLVKANRWPIAITAITLPEDRVIGYTILKTLLRDIKSYTKSMAHIIAGDFQNTSRELLKSYHELPIMPKGTRFRLGYVPDVTDYVMYDGPIAALESSTKSLVRPDVQHEGSDHSPIFVFFFLSTLMTNIV